MSRLLPRYTDTPNVVHPPDPLEQALAEHERKRQEAIAKLEAGHVPLEADPSDLRGIPCIARGVGGTSPGSNPLTETIRRMSVRRTTLHSDCA